MSSEVSQPKIDLHALQKDISQIKDDIAEIKKILCSFQQCNSIFALPQPPKPNIIAPVSASAVTGNEIDEEKASNFSKSEIIREAKTIIVNQAKEIAMDVAMAGVNKLISIGKSVPMIAPFAVVVEDLISVLNAMKCNKAAAVDFRDRLNHFALIISDLVELSSDATSQSFKQTLNKMQDDVASAKKYLVKFTKTGFLTTLLKGNEPQRKFTEFDETLSKRVQEMSTILGMENLRCLQNLNRSQPYQVVCNLEAVMGINSAQISADPAMARKIADAIGADLQDVQNELLEIVKKIQQNTEMILVMLDEGIHTQLHVLSLRKFWKSLISPNSDVRVDLFLKHVATYLIQECHSNTQSAGKLVSSLKDVIENPDEGRAGWIDVYKIRQYTIALDESVDFQEAISCMLSSNRIEKRIIPAMSSVLKYSMPLDENDIDALDTLVWGLSVKQSMLSMIQIPSAQVCICGSSNVGKTFRLWALLHRLPETSVLWINAQCVKNKKSLYTAINKQLCLAMEEQDSILGSFVSLMERCVGSQKQYRCIVVFDHVSSELIFTLKTLIEESIRPIGCHIVIVCNDEREDHRNRTVLESSGFSVCEIDALQISEATELGQRLGKTEVQAQRLARAARCLPGFMISYQGLPEVTWESLALTSQGLPIPNSPINSNAPTSLLGLRFTAQELLVARCLYSSLKTGFVFPKRLAWILCKDKISSLMSAMSWNDVFRTLISKGWLMPAGENKFVLSSSSISPSDMKTYDDETEEVKRLNAIVVSHDEQWSLYYNYWCEEYVRIDKQVEGRDTKPGVLFFEDFRDHFEYVHRMLIDSVSLDPQSMVSIAIAISPHALRVGSLRMSYLELSQLYQALICILTNTNDINSVTVIDMCALYWTTASVAHRYAMLHAVNGYALALVLRLHQLDRVDPLVVSALDALAQLEGVDVLPPIKLLKLKVSLMQTRGTVRLSKAQWVEAESFFQVTYDLCKAGVAQAQLTQDSTGDDNILGLMVKVAINFTTPLNRLARNDKVKAILEEVMDTVFHQYGADSNVAALLYRAKAENCKAMQEHDKAHEYFEKAIEVAKSSYGKTHSTTGLLHYYYGVYLLSVQEFSKAIDYLRFAVDLRVKSFANDNDTVDIFLAAVNFQLGYCYFCRGQENDHATAIPYLTAAVTQGRTQPNKKAELCSYLYVLAAAESSTKQFQASMEHNEESLRLRRALNKYNTVETIENLSNLVKCCISLSNKSLALQNALEMIDLVKIVHGATSLEVAKALEQGASIYRTLNNPTEALNLYNQAYAIAYPLMSSDRAAHTFGTSLWTKINELNQQAK